MPDDKFETPENIELAPAFKEKLQKPMYRPHLDIIHNLIRKLGLMGIGCLKIIDIEDGLLLGEMKVMRPPYRLYVIVDQKSKKFYVMDWEHKQKQPKVISGLKEKLSLAVQMGMSNIFT